MATSTRSVEFSVDEFYFSALFDSDEMFPISDEKYAEELALQEALVSATSRTLKTSEVEIKKECFVPTVQTQMPNNIFKGKLEKLEYGQPSLSKSVSTTTTAFCVICMDAKPAREMFANSNCPHSFCLDCIAKHVAAKIQENIHMVRCPEPKCGVVLEPHLLNSIVPKRVLERWESALCESAVLGLKKIYCPFEDCSAMMVDDGCVGETVTACECASCHRLFCAQCRAPWHGGTECSAFRAAKKSDCRFVEKEAEKMVYELAEKNKWRRCPGCNFYIEKNEGCLHISCRCGNEFCYSCGSAWSSGHSCLS